MGKRQDGPAPPADGACGVDRLIAEASPETLTAVEAELAAEFEALTAERATERDQDQARAAYVIDALSRIRAAGSSLEWFHIWRHRRALKRGLTQGKPSG